MKQICFDPISHPSPAKVLAIGVGLAGLGAIGTSILLGAIIHAFEKGPEVTEQIDAGFVFLEFDDHQDKTAINRYAVPSPPEFCEK
jgi:NAD(P) transhydrogenase subunit alpha